MTFKHRGKPRPKEVKQRILGPSLVMVELGLEPDLLTPACSLGHIRCVPHLSVLP